MFLLADHSLFGHVLVPPLITMTLFLLWKYLYITQLFAQETLHLGRRGDASRCLGEACSVSHSSMVNLIEVVSPLEM